MEKIFSGKVALVTGAAGGIGRAAALAFSKRAAKVVIADWRDGSETVNIINKLGGEAFFIKTDVSKEGDVMAMVEQTIKEYGRLDYAYNNAGTEGSMSLIQDVSEADWDNTVNVNLKGIFLCIKHEIPAMLNNGGGAIVNCASVAGLVGFQGATPYVASKHGIVGITKSVGLEYAKTGIRCNAVCPGVIDTEMIERATQGNPEMEKMLTAGEPVGRLGRPEEIAETVVWLCSESASFITGVALPVDGGWVAQ